MVFSLVCFPWQQRLKVSGLISPKEGHMEKNDKKRYEKPKLTKVRLDPKCAVLGFCKNTGNIGPGVPNCGIPMAPCYSSGS